MRLVIAFAVLVAGCHSPQGMTDVQERLQRIELHRAAQQADIDRAAQAEADAVKRQATAQSYRNDPVGGGCRRDGVLVDCLATP